MELLVLVAILSLGAFVAYKLQKSVNAKSTEPVAAQKVSTPSVVNQKKKGSKNGKKSRGKR